MQPVEGGERPRAPAPTAGTKIPSGAVSGPHPGDEARLPGNYPFFFSNSCMNETSASIPSSGKAL